MAGNSGRYELLGNRALRVTWTLGDGSVLSLVANLSSEPLDGINVWGEDHLWLEGFATGDTLEAWSAVFTLERAA
jgi:maltooligosyltrehalose trehalohydrolase